MTQPILDGSNKLSINTVYTNRVSISNFAIRSDKRLFVFDLVVKPDKTNVTIHYKTVEGEDDAKSFKTELLITSLELDLMLQTLSDAIFRYVSDDRDCTLKTEGEQSNVAIKSKHDKPDSVTL